MINIYEVFETNKMIEKENLDVRTITMGISLLDCADSNLDVLCQNIYDKICRLAKDLVKTGEDISREFGSCPSTARRCRKPLVPFRRSVRSSSRR